MDPDLAILMVVEDDGAFRGWLSAVLRNAGHEMVAAESAEGAIECMGRVTPDLALIDVMLPGLSGFDLVAELRARDATVNLPVILISALGQRHFVRQGMELGADDFIAKPVSADEVIRSVETRLRRAGCAAATPPRATKSCISSGSRVLPRTRLPIDESPPVHAGAQRS